MKATLPGGAPAVRRHPGGSWLLTAALVLAGACTHRPPPPTPESPPASRPLDLSGATVMVLPAQPALGTPQSAAAAFDAELAYWLGDRAPRVHWIMPAELERLVQSSPALRIDLHALDVRGLRRMRVQRIGDPLFGDVHNLGAMLDARVALLPASIAYVAHDSAGQPAGPGRLEVSAILVQTFGGEVVWRAVVAGDAGPIDAPATAASAARALARALTPGN